MGKKRGANSAQRLRIKGRFVSKETEAKIRQAAAEHGIPPERTEIVQKWAAQNTADILRAVTHKGPAKDGTRRGTNAGERLRYKGRFISKEKADAVKFVAEKNGVRPGEVQRFMDQNKELFSGYIERGNVDVTFNENQAFRYIQQFEKVTINGERTSKKNAALEVQKFINYLKKNFEAAHVIFNGDITDQRTGKGGKKYEEFARLNLKIPRRRKRGESEEEYLEFLEDEEGITIIVSGKK